MLTMFIVMVSVAILSVTTHTLAESLTKPVAVIGNFLTIRLAHNPGIAFSILLPGAIQGLLICLALTLVIILALRSKRALLPDIGFGMIIGGAIGNLVDRVPDGLVTDFISLGTFPIFNVADSFICIGVGILLLESIAMQPKPQRR